MELFSSIIIFFFVLLYPPLRRAFFAPGEKEAASAHKGRYPFFDFAKGIAISAVVLIHSIYIFSTHFPGHGYDWFNAINNASRFAVGFFFLASGALLAADFSGRGKLLSFYKRKITRILLPFVLVSVVVGISQGLSWDLVVGGVVRGDLLPPFYFIPVLVQFYLLFPLLARFRHSKLFLPVSLFVSYLFYLTQGANYILGVPFFGQFLFLFAFGMANAERLKRPRPFGRLDAWVLVVLVYLATQFMFPEHYYNTRLFYAPALLVLLHALWLYSASIRSAGWVQSLGKLSLWVYLIHFSVQELVMATFPFAAPNSVYVYLLGVTAATLAASWVVAILVSKITIFKN